MIVSRRNYPFGSRVTTLETKRYSCVVSTAKDGLLNKQSTAVLELPPDGLGPRRQVAQVTYISTLNKLQRLVLHDLIASTLDAIGQTASLGSAIDAVEEQLLQRGLASEVVNLIRIFGPSSWDEVRAPDTSISPEDKVVVSCPKCATEMRVPLGKLIDITCPSCRAHFRQDLRAGP